MIIATTETATITARQLTDYNEIVQPQQRFLISDYFIDHWLSRLGPTFSWIVLSLQQACWRADDNTCTIAQAAIAEEIGLERRSVGRIMRDNPYRHWFIPEITHQPGEFDPRSQTYHPLPNRYQVHPFTPLIPEHLAGLYVYFRDVGPIDEVAAAVDRLLALRPKEALALLEELAPGAGRPFERPHSPAAVVQLATGLDLAGLPARRASALLKKLDQLDTHLTDSSHTVCRQYFRKTWVPILGPGMAWLVLVLRSRCYYNAKTDETREDYTWSKKELRDLLGISRNSLPLFLAHPYADQFFEVLENSKQHLTIRTLMQYEPLTTAAIDAGQNGPSQPENGSKCDITPPGTHKNVTSPPPGTHKNVTSPPPKNAQKCDITPSERTKMSHHPPQNAQKCDTCKYFKDSVLDVVVKDNNSTLQHLLSNAGLSGRGLAHLCQQPLDPQTVRAVILYAGANALGPGYIYQHLHNGDPVDPRFLELAALDEGMLEVFQAAAAELAATGVLSPQTQAGIPPDRVELFARYAGAVIDYEVEAVAAMVKRGAVVAERADAPEPAPDALEQLWERVKERLSCQMSPAVFAVRVKNTRVRERQGNRFTIAAPDRPSREWLAHRFTGLIGRALASELGTGDIELAFVV